MKGAGKFTILAGVLPVALAWVAGLSGLPMAHRPVTNVLAEVLAVLLLVLSWRFRRGRLAVAALAIALANFLLRGPMAEDPAAPAGSALAFLLPVTLVILALLPERPIDQPLILALLAVVVAESWLVTAIGRTGAGSPGQVLGAVGELLTTPNLARLFFLISGAFVALAFAARRGSFEGSLLWVMAASAIALLGSLGPHAATLALSAAQIALLIGLIEDSYRLAYHDELTGLPGRRALEEALRALDGDYTIAMVDVDHFKRFNDRHGHSAGDQALRMVATELQGVGGGGRAYRYGGEEFAIVFPGASPARVRDQLDNVREKIAGRRFALRAPDRPRKKPDTQPKKSRTPRLISVSVSIGVAGSNPRRNSPETVLRAADNALYRAKSAGRNRLVTTGDKVAVKKP